LAPKEPGQEWSVPGSVPAAAARGTADLIVTRFEEEPSIEDQAKDPEEVP
jgi:hypothetical protein